MVAPPSRVNELVQDLKFGWRLLLKSPGFTVVALATLGIGIGANTAIFSFVDGVLLKPLPYAEPERIIHVLEKPPGGGRNGISTLNYLDWAKENTVFEFLAAETGGSMILTGTAEPLQLRGSRVTVDYFRVFGIEAAQGRTFAVGEDQFGHDRVAILSHGLWQRQFGGDPAMVGRTIQLNGESHTVIGILPATSAFDRGFAQIWRPLAFAPENMTRNFHWFGAMARLKRGVTLEQARAQMDTIGARIAADYPEIKKGWGVSMVPWSEIVVGGQLRQSLYVLLAAVGMVLLIACANLANIMLVRAIARDREVAIRASLGASRGRLLRQFLTESLLLAGGGGLLGTALGFAMLAGLKTALPPFALPREADVALDGRVLLFSAGLAGLTGIICGLAPALRSVRANLATAVKEAGTGGSVGRAGSGFRTTLIVTEVALAFVLLTGAGLMLRSFAALFKVDPGFDSTSVITAGLPVPNERFRTVTPYLGYLREISDSIAALPGVSKVAFTSALPMQGWGYGMPFRIAGRPAGDAAARRACFFKMISPSYFETLGMKLLKGRLLTVRDVGGGPPVAVINETMRQRLFPNEDPLGKQIMIEQIEFGKTKLGAEIPWEVVGVVADELVGGLAQRTGSPGVYVTIEQSAPAFQALVVRGTGDPAPLFRAVQEAVRRVNKDQPLPDMKLLDQIKVESMGDNRLRATLLGMFAAVALLLSAIGIYGVVSYSVAQRTREFGVRSALGASAGDILRLVLRDAMTTVVLGLLIGVGGVFALIQFVSSLLFGVGERDPTTLAVVAAILAAVAFVACVVPARRGSKVDPIQALRYE